MKWGNHALEETQVTLGKRWREERDKVTGGGGGQRLEDLELRWPWSEETSRKEGQETRRPGDPEITRLVVWNLGDRDSRRQSEPRGHVGRGYLKAGDQETRDKEEIERSGKASSPDIKRQFCSLLAGKTISVDDLSGKMNTNVPENACYFVVFLSFPLFVVCFVNVKHDYVEFSRFLND